METQAQITITFNNKTSVPTVEIVGRIPRRGITLIPRALRNAANSHEGLLRRGIKAQLAEKERLRKIEEAETVTVNSAEEQTVEDIQEVFDSAVPEPTGPLNHVAGIAPEFRLEEEEEEDNATLTLEDEDILDEQDEQEGIDGTTERS